MARLPALVTAFSTFDPRDRSTIEHFARIVREHGRIPTTKRGVGAAEMGAPEAAALFIALNGSDAPKGAVEALNSFGLLRLKGGPDVVRGERSDLDLAPEFLNSALRDRNFEEAVAEFFRILPQVRDCCLENIASVYKTDSRYKSWERLLSIYGLTSIELEIAAIKNAYIYVTFLDNSKKWKRIFWKWSDEKNALDFVVHRKVVVGISSAALFHISRTIDPDSWKDPMYDEVWENVILPRIQGKSEKSEGDQEILQ